MQTTAQRMPERLCSRWFARSGVKAQATVRLFCFPYAGGSSNTYRSWQGLLPETIDVTAVQLPGRGERLSEPPLERLSGIVEALAHEVGPYLDKPFAFFGHSMGALIALELTRWLRRNHKRMPVHLFVSGRRAPHIPDPVEPAWDLPEQEFIDRVRQLNGTPHDVLDHPELMQLIIPFLRADFAACETYEHQPEPPLACPITVFGGVDDEEVSCEHLEPWREHTTSAYRLHLFPGDHFFVQTAQAELLPVIAEALGVER